MRPQVVEPPLQVVAIQMLLLNGYLGSVAIRTIVRARDVIVFEVVQTAAALAVGFGGAVYVAQRSGSGVAALALLNLAVWHRLLRRSRFSLSASGRAISRSTARSRSCC
jgi:hypothetical protein